MAEPGTDDHRRRPPLTSTVARLTRSSTVPIHGVASWMLFKSRGAPFAKMAAHLSLCTGGAVPGFLLSLAPLRLAFAVTGAAAPSIWPSWAPRAHSTRPSQAPSRRISQAHLGRCMAAQHSLISSAAAPVVVTACPLHSSYSMHPWHALVLLARIHGLATSSWH